MVVTEISENLSKKFNRALKSLKEATKLTQENKAKELLSIIEPLLDTPEGTHFIYEHSLELEQAGIFAETVWERPSDLVPTLSGGTLKMDHPSSTYEILSDLRMLKYMNTPDNNRVSDTEAKDYLESFLVSNFKLIFSPNDEETRKKLTEKHRRKIKNMFDLVLNELPFDNLKDELGEELEMICEQRPIITTEAEEVIHLIDTKIELNPENDDDRKILKYINAVKAPTKSLRDEPNKSRYIEYLQGLSPEQLSDEATELGDSMMSTGLVSQYHVVFLGFVHKSYPKILSKFLGLDKRGKSELYTHLDFVQVLIEKAISQDTKQSIYGLAQLLSRGLLSRSPVKNGLSKVLKLILHPKVEFRITKSENYKKDTNPLSLVVAGIISIFGQPLGVGQGLNPTCQAARGISLWSQHAPGKLISLILTAAETDNLDFYFEGSVLQSDELPEGLAGEIDYNLDIVSLILVPHLDKIYNEMMKRAAMRGEDPHKWVNPALYGQWIQTGFYSAYDYTLNAVNNYEDFVRTFYSSFHPKYNGGNDLIYPNPVGIFITSAKGKLLGFHAISLLRVAESPSGEWRAYFLNPNNEGRQNWGQNIKPTVFGNGERHGESSLPFDQFVARLYAFHYNRLSLGNKDMPDNKEIENIIKLAKSSWGESYNWINQKNYYG